MEVRNIKGCRNTTISDEKRASSEQPIAGGKPTGLIPPRKPDSIRFANQPPELAPSSDDPLWDACALVQLIRPVIQREATQDTAAFVAPRSMGFVLLAAGWTVGLILWFMRNRFVGSYLFFRITRRS